MTFDTNVLKHINKQQWLHHIASRLEVGDCVANSLGYCSLKSEQETVIKNFIMEKVAMLPYFLIILCVSAQHY